MRERKRKEQVLKVVTDQNRMEVIVFVINIDSHNTTDQNNLYFCPLLCMGFAAMRQRPGKIKSV